MQTKQTFIKSIKTNKQQQKTQIFINNYKIMNNKIKTQLYSMILK